MSDWFAKLGERYKDDPAYITHRLLLDVTEQLTEVMQKRDIGNVGLARVIGDIVWVQKFFDCEKTSLRSLVRVCLALGLEPKIALVPHTALEPQLWLCRDADGTNWLVMAEPSWTGSYWQSPSTRDEIASDDSAMLATLFNLLPGQAVALHTGERREGGDHVE